MSGHLYKPVLTRAELELLEAQLDGTRKGSKVIKVDRTALEHILRDHTNMFPLPEYRGKGRVANNEITYDTPLAAE